MKFTVFTDLHHNPGVFFTEAEQRLKAILKRAKESEASFVIHCGDFCHHPGRSGELLNIYRECGLPVYHCMGNHDCDFLDDYTVMERYGMPGSYYTFDQEGFRFIVLDTNYIRTDNDTFLHFSAGNYYAYPKEQLYHIPPEELLWLRQTLETSPYPCVIFSHHSLEREVNGVKNGIEVRQVLEKDGKTVLCINGHYHCSGFRQIQKIGYLDLNSTSYHWMGMEHGLYPMALVEQYSLMNRTLVYENPLSAVITLDSDARIQVEGCSGSFWQNISLTETGLPTTDACGRMITADILSVSMCATEI